MAGTPAASKGWGCVMIWFKGASGVYIDRLGHFRGVYWIMTFNDFSWNYKVYKNHGILDYDF